MKNNFLTILLLFTSMLIFGQKGSFDQSNMVTIKGKVIEKENNQNLEYATIVLTPINGKEISGGITDTNGNFDIRVKKGVYNISIEFISFKSKKILNKQLTQNTDLGTIALEINAETLKEVEVVAEKSTVEIHLDKKVYNVGKDMTVKGGTASDVLDNVPSVSVDVEGNVSLRGNDNVRILVNGKPSGLVGLTSTDALRQLPADAIEKVEVITSPSARYDAEGTAGILNIILRKGKAQGFNASVNASAGNPDNYGIGVNLNYRTKKVNYFSSSSVNYRNAPGYSSSDVTYLNPSATTPNYRNDYRLYERENKSFNTRFGAEYLLSDKASVTGSILINGSNGNNISTNTSNEFDSNKLLTLTDIRKEDSKQNRHTVEYSFNYTQNFKKEGHKLTADFQFDNSTDNNASTITDNTTFPSLIVNDPERNSTDKNSKQFIASSDYVLPFGKNSQFEFGVKADLNKIKSNYLVEQFDSSTGQYYNNTNYSNNLNFQQNIFAVYTQYGSKINKFSYLFGLRSETTDRTISLENTGTTKKNFTELFPTINLGLELSENENLTLGYSRRLRRPREWFLNPFESRLSETYIMRGNINLDPEYSNSFDLGYYKKWKKLALNTSIYYQHTSNEFEMVLFEETRLLNNIPTLVIIRNPINLNSEDNTGIDLTINYNPYKWWRLMTNYNFFKSVSTGSYNNISYDSNQFTWFARFNSKITLPGKIDWQTTAMFRGPSKTVQSKRKAMGMVNLAFSKDILKEKATISLNVSDLLNTRKRVSTDYSPTTITQSEFQWRKRQILLNFTYRFNQKKKNEKPTQNMGGGDDEGGGEL